MREFTYTGAAGVRVFVRQLAGVAAIALGTSTAVVLVLLGLWQIPLSDPAIWTPVCFAIWFAVIGWTVGFGLINFHPTVWVGDEGLAISYFGRRVIIPWDEIVDVGAGWVPFGHTLVRARRITPFHRLYGWMYSLTFLPSFVIGRGIQNRDELLREISKRMHVKHVR